jgi:hypothetical protein
MSACPRCLRDLSADDTVELDGPHLVHLDCRRPRRLTREERELLGRYCAGHTVAECVSCTRRFRQGELLEAIFGDDPELCPHCRTDLTDGLRAHLNACTMLPEQVRRRAQEAREAARRLVKQSRQLTDRADVLTREAEVSLAALREATRPSRQEELRHIIRVRLEDGNLPDAPPPVAVGCPGDGSRCGACDEILTARVLMMIVPSIEGGSISLHGDCFQIWNAERLTFRKRS